MIRPRIRSAPDGAHAMLASVIANAIINLGVLLVILLAEGWVGRGGGGLNANCDDNRYGWERGWGCHSAYVGIE